MRRNLCQAKRELHRAAHENPRLVKAKLVRMIKRQELTSSELGVLLDRNKHLKELFFEAS